MNDVILNGTKFFFHQEEQRRIPRRLKKNLEDLPAGIRFSPTKAKTTTTSSTRSADDIPDVLSECPTQDASIEEKQEPKLESKESKESKDSKESTVTIGDTTLNENFALNLHSVPDDSQHLVFENYKSLALISLTKLGQLLDYFEIRKQPPKVPKFLEVAFLSEFKDLIGDVIYSVREWQTLNAKNSWDQECRKKYRDSDDSRSVIDSNTTSGEFPSDKTRTDKDNSQLPVIPKISRAKSRSKLKAKASGLGNISEDEELMEGKPRTTRSGSGTSQMLGIPGKKKIEKFRPADQMSRTSVSDRGSRRFGDDTSMMEGDSENSGRSVKGYYVSVVHFALSSRACEEKGWIVHDDASASLERQTILEWARQRLSTSMRHREEQIAQEKEQGHDKHAEVVYYGEVKKEKYKPQKQADVLNSNLQPDVPNYSDTMATPGRSVFSASTIDGSTCVYYPSGHLAIMYSQAGLGRDGYYVSVFDDNISMNMLANFTHSGRGACNHSNGVVRLLSTDKEILMMDQNGACQKRWAWPATMTAKLPGTIQLQLNSQVAFRCVSRSQMCIIYTHGKQTITFKMAHSLVQPEYEDTGRLQSGMSFSSQSAKEINRQARFRSASQRRDKKKKEKKAADKDKTDEVNGETVDDNFELDSDKELSKLSKKIEFLVVEWMSLYRTSLRLLKMRSPSPERRSKSAKSTPGELLRQLPAQSGLPGRRAGTAPAGREIRAHASRVKSSFRFDESGPVTQTKTPVSSPSKSPRPGIDEKDGADGLFDDKRRGVCPVALCRHLLGQEDWSCRCSKHHMPVITDVEYDTFIQHLVPDQQTVVVCVTSSLYPRSSQGCETMLARVYSDMNRNRSSPCSYSAADPYRVLKYDMATCTEYSDHTQPLLMWRHNVIPGMILMYQAGKLLFADHIFNGYGNARKDFTKQVLKTKREARVTGGSLPDDFRFSPQLGRRGARAAWGGQIGGAGIDRYANPGMDARGTYLPVRRCQSASTNSTDSSLPVCVAKQHHSLAADTLPSSSNYATSASYPGHPCYQHDHEPSSQESVEYQKRCLAVR